MVDLFERLTGADLQAVHFHLFKGVHPWAGEFRKPGQMAVVAGFPAADPARIRRELELALYQTRHLLADAFGDELPARPLRADSSVSGRQRPLRSSRVGGAV